MTKKFSRLLFLCLVGTAIQCLGQNNLVLEKDYEISRKAKKGYLGEIEEKENGQFDLVYFLPSSKYKVKIETYRFDKDCSLLNTTAEEWDIEKVRTRYKRFRYKGDFFITNLMSVSANMASKLVFRKKQVTGTWNWWQGGYVRNVKMLDKIKLTNEEGNKYQFYGGAYEVERDSAILVFANSIGEKYAGSMKNYELLKVNNQGAVEVKKKIQFPYAVKPLFSKPLIDDNSSTVENDDDPRDWILVMAPSKLSATKQDRADNPAQLTYLRISPEGDVKEQFDFTAPRPAGRIIDAYEKDGAVILYGVATGKNDDYADEVLGQTVSATSADAEDVAAGNSQGGGMLGGFKKMANMATGKDELQPTQDKLDEALDLKKYTDFVIGKIQDGKLIWVNSTTIDEVNSKAVGTADMKKPLKFDGNKFKVNNLMFLQDGSMALSAQDFKTNNQSGHTNKFMGTITGTSPRARDAGNKIYKGLYLLHFGTDGKLLHNFTNEVEQKNKKGFFNNSPLTADMYPTTSFIYESKDGKTINWVMEAVKAIDKDVDIDIRTNYLAGTQTTTTTSSWSPLYGIEYGQINKKDGTASAFKSLGEDEKRKFYLYNGLNRIRIGDYMYYISETTRGDQVLVSRLSLNN